MRSSMSPVGPTSMSASLPTSPGSRLAAPGQLRSRLICAHCGRSWLARPLSKADIMSADALGSFGRSGQQTTKRRPANRTSSDISGPTSGSSERLFMSNSGTHSRTLGQPPTYSWLAPPGRSEFLDGGPPVWGGGCYWGIGRAWSCWWRRDAEGRGSERTEADAGPHTGQRNPFIGEIAIGPGNGLATWPRPSAFRRCNRPQGTR